MSLLARLFIGVLRLYQTISAFGLPRCRFYPTCSAYACEAIARYGAWRGVGWILVRLAKCHPWHPGGYHPVH